MSVNDDEIENYHILNEKITYLSKRRLLMDDKMFYRKSDDANRTNNTQNILIIEFIKC